jgi:type 1 glutamine amidotransferase
VTRAVERSRIAAAVLASLIGLTPGPDSIVLAATVPTTAWERVLADRPEDRERIERALPARATVEPRRPRHLLIFDLNVNYGGHRSIEYANYAFARMGEITGTYETVIRRDPAVFRPGTLRSFDAVFLNNTVGNLFTDPELRQSLLEFVLGGGGLLGVHGTSVAFTRWPGAHEDWPEFGRMLGARGASHRESDEHVFVRLEEPAHPLLRAFGGSPFDYRDEFFRFEDPYSRQRVRVLLSIDTDRTDLEQGRAFGRVVRPDNDYPVAWIRRYGRGRVFYSTIGHNPHVFWDPTLLEFHLDAIQFALGDLDAHAIPSAVLTPAIRAREQLGWRFGLEPHLATPVTLFESIQLSAALGLVHLGAAVSQRVHDASPTNLGPELADDELRQIRFALDDAGVRLLTFSLDDIPADETACRRLFEFGRKLGVDIFIAPLTPEALDAIEPLADLHDIRLAFRTQDADRPPHSWRPQDLLETLERRGPNLGVAVDLHSWIRAGVDPIEGIRVLGHRLFAIRIQDPREPDTDRSEAPEETLADDMLENVLLELQQLGLRPVMIGLGYSTGATGSSAGDLARRIEQIDELSLRWSRSEELSLPTTSRSE